MLIETTRFGKVDIDGSRVITFKDGPLGFPNHRRFALIQTTGDEVFFWMQSLHDPALAFLVCDPLVYVPDYQAQIRPDDLKALQLRDLTDCRVLVIVNKNNGYLTANLLGPLVIGAHSLLAKQLVLSDKRYGTRHPLVRVDPPAAVSKTA
jgi:flagellar assembly factor FliW